MQFSHLKNSILQQQREKNTCFSYLVPMLKKECTEIFSFIFLTSTLSAIKYSARHRIKNLIMHRTLTPQFPVKGDPLKKHVTHPPLTYP